MNDYAFGNRMLELRKKLNLSQAELAEMIGVTNKAVSKWETGKSKPTTNVIRKLAALFNIDVNDLLSLKDEEREMNISKIVITGGPCAGKST
ncbi:MAG: helix-turn-helix domain-containing protein, partial [Clostridiaceae bacterium]|nr:helix-turn-helix domain-containing protein [Clostridiaceae bacterium]